MHVRERAVALQFGDFILELQLSPFHFGQFQLILGGIHQFLRNFLVERIVTLSERGQMGLTRHAELLFKVHIDLGVCHRIRNSRSCFDDQHDQIFSRLERCKLMVEGFTFAVAGTDPRKTAVARRLRCVLIDQMVPFDRDALSPHGPASSQHASGFAWTPERVA
jgi:hypothetical protein